MSLISRYPSLFPEYNRAFSMLDEPFLNTLTRNRGNSSMFRPAVDITETENNYIVEAELPGIRKEDLDIEFTSGNTLVLKGKVEQIRTTPPAAQTTTPTEGGPVTLPTKWEQERYFGSFQRTLTFPGNVDPTNVKAAYKDGILSIEVPKVMRQSNKISIQY